jgi:hypothetical protein
MVAAVPLATIVAAVPTPARAANAHVLRVGTFHGIPGQYTSIQAAVNAAHPGDWVLVAPGDYRESGAAEAGVLITMPNIHIRGLDRNKVIVDGTKTGNSACSSAPAAQPSAPAGRNGIEVLKVDGVSVQNLTVCNFLSGTDGNGNQVWWNGGDGSGKIGMGSYRGSYLTASTSFFSAGPPAAAAMYGVFASNASGPGTIEHAYASNMADSSFYIGACPDCNAVIDSVHAENSALGYSGSNAGGHLVIEDSVWNDNRAGIVPNSLATDDLPSPQDGACPNNPSRSCTLIEDNDVHDNNNPNTPAVGLASLAPIGAGIELAGSRNDTVRHNLVTHQGGWGIVVNDFPDTSPPINNPEYCAGGIPGVSTPFGTACYFVAFNNRVLDNRLRDNGSFGNPSNVDLADSSIPFPVNNCFKGNRDRDGLSSDPANIQSPAVLGTCGVPGQGDTGVLQDQLACAAFNVCPNGGTYPQATEVRLLPIPHNLATMPEPCEGVPDNPWCDD